MKSLIEKRRKNLLTLCMGLAFVASAVQAADCDLLQLEAVVANGTFRGSAVVVQLGTRNVLVSADHVLPFELNQGGGEGMQLRARWNGRSGSLTAPVRVLRRDWSSDLMILELQNAADSATLRPCRVAPLGRGSVNFKMEGYPVASPNVVSRAAQIVDGQDSEVRVSQVVPLIKVVGGAENGMSGGGLFSPQGGLIGILIQDWYSENHEYKGGAFALPLDFVMERLSEMMSRTSSVEFPLPFTVRRDGPEMSAFGFRFRMVRVSEDVEQPVSNSFRLMGGGGGHPDGIGGSLRTELQIIGLSGDPVPPAWEAMERVFRRAQSEGGIEMRVARTEQGESVRTLTELGRVILSHGESLPELEFILKQLEGPRTDSREGGNLSDLDRSLGKMVIVAFRIAEYEPALLPFAGALRSSYSEWVRTRSLNSAVKLMGLVGQNEEALAKLPFRNGPAWNALIEFRVEQMKVQRILSQR